MAMQQQDLDTINRERYSGHKSLTVLLV